MEYRLFFFEFIVHQEGPLYTAIKYTLTISRHHSAQRLSSVWMHLDTVKRNEELTHYKTKNSKTAPSAIETLHVPFSSEFGKTLETSSLHCVKP